MASTVDFRNLDEGFGGKTYKRKRQESDASITTNGTDGASAADMEIDVDAIPPPAKRSSLPSADDEDKPSSSSASSLGKPGYNGVIAGKVSGRKWKQPRAHRASAKHVSVKGKSLEEREREKEIKRAYRERMEELKEEIRWNKIEKRKKREEREKKKQENILRSGTKLQKISNPKTLQKISKSKQKKLLKVVPDDLLNKNKKKK